MGESLVVFFDLGVDYVAFGFFFLSTSEDGTDIHTKIGEAANQQAGGDSFVEGPDYRNEIRNRRWSQKYQHTEKSDSGYDNRSEGILFTLIFGLRYLLFFHVLHCPG